VGDVIGSGTVSGPTRQRSRRPGSADIRRRGHKCSGVLLLRHLPASLTYCDTVEHFGDSRRHLVAATTSAVSKMTQFGVGQSPLPAFDRELANALSRIFCR
jgi:2-keto-4-pentenoate hydratase/2-oxohepta-3-ene-1,7-dioic acid hydratase in catechol pathway